MGRKALIASIAVVVIALVGAVGVYAWDSAYDEEIAEGVTIGGIDVGGMEPAEAVDQVAATLVRPLSRPVEVRHDDESFRLRPKQIAVRADLEGMIDEALAASRDGSIFSRTWRRVSGGEVDHQVEPRVSYDREAVAEFVEGVVADLHREPVDASVEPSAGSIDPVPSQNGQAVDQEALSEKVDAALQARGRDRIVEADVEKLRPEVRTADLADRYPHYLVVDRPNFTLRYYRNLELERTYTVAIGQVGNDTPTGLYNITNKAVDPVWNVPNSDWAGELAGRQIPPGPDNPLKARWLGVYDGVGIHGTADEGSLGRAASRGCIRMSVPEVKELYEVIPVGTPIYIA